MAYRADKRHPDEEQIANAPDWLFALAPVSEAPARQVRLDWSAVLSTDPVYHLERNDV